jgi:transcription elongation GreA/GreB family factor
VVGLGSKVVVSGADGAEQTWHIVSSHDAAPKEGRLSVESPMALALLGRTAGDETSVATPRGTRVLTVLNVG